MNVARWHATLIAVKVAPERGSQVIKVASTHIDIAGSQGGSTQFLQKGVDIPDRVEDVTAYDDVSFQIGGGILPGCGHIGDIGDPLLSCVLLQILQHRCIRLDRYHLFCKWCESQHKASGSCSYVQYGCLGCDNFGKFQI